MNDHALSFGVAADAYDRHRPSYPRAAVTWALAEPTAPLRVLDLGAGTGILTRVLRGLGHEVTSLEPDEAMRASLARATPGATPLAGSAEAIPLPDDSVDAVVAGQAYHWFDPTRAPVEIARVLRPGGHFAALWNLRDESVRWVARLSEAAHLADRERDDQGVHEDQLLAAGFGPVTRAVFTHAVTLTPESLVELIKTRSYYLVAPAEHQAEVVTAVRRLTAEDPDLAGRASFDLPYRTVVHRTRLGS